MKYDNQNIFAKIIKGEAQCEKVYEDELVIAFNDIHPVAPVHVIVIPKDKYISFDDFARKASPYLIVRFFQTVQRIATDLDLQESGYRIVTNHGNDALQTIKHFHVHILGKKKLGGLVAGDKHHEPN